MHRNHNRAAFRIDCVKIEISWYRAPWGYHIAVNQGYTSIIHQRTRDINSSWRNGSIWIDRFCTQICIILRIFCVHFEFRFETVSCCRMRRYDRWSWMAGRAEVPCPGHCSAASAKVGCNWSEHEHNMSSTTEIAGRHQNDYSFRVDTGKEKNQVYTKG